jgi:hypothetical protein
MRRIAYFLLASTILLLTPLGSLRAQDVPADITVVSVLTMAKEEAEKGRTEHQGAALRHRVARFIENTGRTSVFGNYVADATSAWEAIGFPSWAGQHVARALSKNRANEAEAKQALLAGDEQQAIEILRRCEFVPHHDLCLTSGDFLHAQLLNWERTSGRLAEALHRLRTADWNSSFMRDRMAFHVARSYASAGRRVEAVEILRQIGDAGPNVAACIVGTGALTQAASLRMLACLGHVRRALDDVLMLPEVSSRIVGLGIVAEGLAGLPGWWDEELEASG